MNASAEVIKPVSDVLVNLWNKIVTFVPDFIVAVLVLLLGYIIAWIIGWLVRIVLDRTGIVDYWIKKADLKKFFKDWDIPHFLGILTKWYVFVLFLPPAANCLEASSLATFFISLSIWIPNLIAAVLIFVIGLVIAEYFAHKIVETKTVAKHTIASIVKIVVILFTAIIALEQIGISVALAHDSFIVVLAGIMLGLAIAFGIAFGYGYKEEAARVVKTLKKRKRF
ncbi:hypothetical protein J7L02_02920 [Candidatus Woesearchaeota archaeon]|nr:hypothetical protein [Candidatus Woesearchaeota archaeon]